MEEFMDKIQGELEKYNQGIPEMGSRVLTLDPFQGFDITLEDFEEAQQMNHVIGFGINFKSKEILLHRGFLHSDIPAVVPGTRLPLPKKIKMTVGDPAEDGAQYAIETEGWMELTHFAASAGRTVVHVEFRAPLVGIQQL